MAFEGSFRLEVAQEATAFGGLDSAGSLDALVGLVEKSLVKVVELDSPRYRLLQTTRLYATERLADAREASEMQLRHGKAMASLAEVAQRRDPHVRSATWLASYLPDYDDLDTAFVNACARGDADVAAAVVVPLRLIDQLRGLFVNSSRRRQLVQGLLGKAGQLSQARLHSFIASCGWIDSPPGSRLDSALRAVALWRDLDQPRDLHGALAIAATETARNAHFAAAEALLREARELEEPNWPDRSVAIRFIHEGWVALFQGDNARYRDSVRAAMALCDRGDEQAMANAARVLLAWATLAAGDIHESVALARRSVEALSGPDQSDNLGQALTVLCEGLLASGEIEAARRAAIQALPLTDPEATHHFDLMQTVAVLAGSVRDYRRAAQLLGYVDGVGPTDVPPIDSILLLVQKTSSEVEAFLGIKDAEALRSWGARIDARDACRIAVECLAA